MKRVVCRLLPVLAIALVIAMVAGVAAAQEGELFATNYFSNNTTAGAPAGAVAFYRTWFSRTSRVRHDLCVRCGSAATGMLRLSG